MPYPSIQDEQITGLTGICRLINKVFLKLIHLYRAVNLPFLPGLEKSRWRRFLNGLIAGHPDRLRVPERQACLDHADPNPSRWYSFSNIGYGFSYTCEAESCGRTIRAGSRIKEFSEFQMRSVAFPDGLVMVFAGFMPCPTVNGEGKEGEAVIAQVNQVHDRKWHQPRISWAVAADEYDRWRLPPGFRLILHRGSDQRRMSRCMKSPTFIYQNCMENPSPRGLPENRLTSKTFNLSCVKPEPVCGVPLAKRIHIMLELFHFERESLVPCEK